MRLWSSEVQDFEARSVTLFMCRAVVESRRVEGVDRALVVRNVVDTRVRQ